MNLKSVLWSFATSLAGHFALRLVWDSFNLDALATDIGDVLAEVAPWLVYGGGS